jgi:hypothetical protein
MSAAGVSSSACFDEFIICYQETLSHLRNWNVMTGRTEFKAADDMNETSHASQKKGLAACPFARECDLRAETVVKVLEQVRQECGMGIVSIWVGILKDCKKGL